MKVLVLNCGSSSIKYKLFDMDHKEVIAQGVKNSLIPNISPWSVTAIPFIPSAIALSTKRGIDAWPSRMEYWVWTCKWTKSCIIVTLLKNCLKILRFHKTCKKIKKKLSTFAFFILNEVEIGISNNFYLQGFQNKFIFAR